MAKKNEFKPDKSGSGLLSKLYITPIQRRAILKWVLYALVLVVLGLLQDVALCNFRLFGASTELVPCAIILICLLEGSQNGCVFTLIAALFYWFSGAALGAFAMVMITVLSILVSMFRQSYLQKGFGAAMLCTVFAVVVYEMAMFLLGAFMGLTPWNRFVGFLLTAGMSLLSAPILYPILLSIESIGGETWRE